MIDKIKKAKELATLLAKVDGPHDVDECPNYYDGCHCVEFLAIDSISIIDDLEKARERISELEARQCDEQNKAKQALLDIINDGPVQCLVAHLHEGTKECIVHDGENGCLACRTEIHIATKIKAKDLEIERLQWQVGELAGKADIYDSARLEVRMLTAQLQQLKRCSKCKSECGPCQCECHGYLYGYR